MWPEIYSETLLGPLRTLVDLAGAGKITWILISLLWFSKIHFHRKIAKIIHEVWCSIVNIKNYLSKIINLVTGSHYGTAASKLVTPTHFISPYRNFYPMERTRPFVLLYTRLRRHAFCLVQKDKKLLTWIKRYYHSVVYK